ncbi:unnamed protein product [Acanthoscelides obtectus]|uniref:Uncharacterized protein n=1 Tax=Acanthoscelides obtectus TaxID=200917 RepID=A0A9P0LBT7_ACAOB|nr:unnamed protein product [Acanthoscelides obtectus]CAK1634052.1 hypothetical protein AOBTE_LOCUS8566 [Acanthoscelides obtectus]
MHPKKTDQIEAFLNDDLIVDFEEFKLLVQTKTVLENWCLKNCGEVFYFYLLNADCDVLEEENDVRSEEISFSRAPLSEDLIDILGKKDTSPEPLGPKIHEDLLLRWEKILKTGLSDDDRKSLLSKLPPPENFTTLSAPLLNPVVQKAISPSNLLRDERLTKLQSLVAASLSGIGQVCSLLLSEEGGGDRRYIKLLNNAGRMLADLWHSQNITRRELISINLSKEFQEATKDIPLDTFLFGQNLDERMKATKSSKEYRKILKAKPPKTITKTHYQAPTSSQRFPATTRSLNHRAPSRYQQGTNRQRSRYYNKTVPPQYRLKQQQHKQRGRPNRQAAHRSALVD